MTAGTRSGGDRLGPYELVRRLGQGAMGEVWEAVLHGPGGFRKPVAVKLLPPGRVDDAELRATLLREARVGALLQHPNVVGTLGVSEHEGAWVVALDLVRGASARDLLVAHGPLPARALLELGVQVAAGLAHAHDAGLVHRDVKPANVLVDRVGLVRLADLGIAVAATDRVRGAGTPGYVAPEQAEGAAGPRSDLFSLGATLYVLATAKRPFGGDDGPVTPQRVERALAGRAFLGPLEEAVPGLGPVVHRCLRADPERRYRSARELSEALAALRTRQPEGGPTLLALLAEARPDLAVEGTTGASEPTALGGNGNLKPPRDRFLGRREELAELRRLVRDGPDRLIVLLGPGGGGKTRLALEVARGLKDGLQGGAWAFDLSRARTADDVCRAVASGLSLALDARDPAAQIGRALAARGRAVVLLDNLEPCLDALPDTLGRWVDEAPAATFLCTSRVVPGLAAERRVAVGPLSRGDALDLFVERAGRPLDPEERTIAADLCAALDGLSLAIELAAARVALLGVAGTRRRLSLALLSGGRRDLPERQRSLEASLDWSTGLLGADARRALARLAAFEGAFTLDAAEAVIDAPDALGALQELADASLLRVDARSGRFSMLRVVREYTSARSPEERGAAELRHARWFAQLGAQPALDALDGPRGTERRRALLVELDDVIAACRRSVARGDGATATAALAAAFAVMEITGPFATVVELARSVAGVAALAPAERAHAAQILGAALRSVGRGAEAAAEYEASLALFRQLGDRRAESDVRVRIGGLHLEQGRVAEGVACYEAGLALDRAIGNRLGEGTTLSNLALAYLDLGRMDEAGELLTAALVVHREVGNRRSEGVVLSNLCTWLRARGRFAEARARSEAALPVLREVGHRRAEGVLLANLAMLEVDLGRPEKGLALNEAALAIHREVGNRRSEGIVLGNIGLVQGRLGRPEARDTLDRALAIHREVGARAFEGVALTHLAEVCARGGRVAEAKAHLEAATGILRAVGQRRYEGAARVELARLVAGHEEALGHLDRADRLLGDDPVGLLRSLAARAERCWSAGDHDGAAQALARAEALGPVEHAGARERVAEVAAVVRGAVTRA